MAEVCYFYNWEELATDWEEVTMVWEDVKWCIPVPTPTPVTEKTSEHIGEFPIPPQPDYGIAKEFVMSAEKQPIAYALTSIEIVKGLKTTKLSDINLEFNKNLLSEKSFFDKTKKIDLLKTSSLATLGIILDGMSMKYEKTDLTYTDDIRVKTILKFASDELDEDDLSEILLACYGELDEEYIPDINENTDTHEILSTLSERSDIDRKINSQKVTKLSNLISSNISKSNSLKEKINSKAIEIIEVGLIAKLAYDELKDFNVKEALEKEKQALLREKQEAEEALRSYKFLLQRIVNMTKNLFSRTEHPSRYRTKYIQKLIRTVYSLMKSEAERLSGAVKTEYEKILKKLKNTDDILIAMALITSIYINNRLALRKRSKNSLISIASDFACIKDIPEESNVPTEVSPIKISEFLTDFSCPISADDVVVPHTPIELKIDDISCELPLNQETNVEVKESPELSSYAIVRNLRKKDKIVPQIKKDTYLTQESKIATINNNTLYSPVEGFVDEIKDNEIIIKDIVDPEKDYLTEQISSLNEKYKRYNDINTFLKNYYIKSLYPVMLSISAIDDASTYDENSGIEKIWKEISKKYDKFIENYDEKIKDIAGKDNVKKHAENETLYEIKEELEEEEEKFYKNLESYGEMAKNYSKKTRAKSNEYELFEYYALDLGAKFNKLEYPSDLEKEFRNEINEFMRKRFIVDGYKKEKLGRKINDLIKDLEKGISLGNWFDKCMDVYLSRRNIDDVEKWLKGLADKNKKLEIYEKTSLINRILFLFKLYLIYNKLHTKYNILKKETTSKDETIKEGNYIIKFFESLWKERKELVFEIEETQQLIEDLSLIKTYSIVDWKGYKARLYTIIDEEPECEPKDTDPYITGKSMYGYGDIRYWLKYCAFATLASIANPVTGWSTGWIFPTPIPFPVIYIPIKSIMTNYGFIVVGVSICGTWIFPWFLLSNLTLNHNTPFGDPTAALKREVNELRLRIADQIKNLKEEFIQKKIDETNKKIDEVDIELKQRQRELIQHKERKPSRFKESKEFSLQGVPKNLDYATQYSSWVEQKLVLQELVITLKTKKWSLEKVHRVLTEAQKLGKSVVGSGEGLEKAENLINKQLDNLMMLINRIDDMLAPLPITMQPDTANFGITLKNPNPIIKIEGKLDDNINKGPLETIFNKFKLRNDNLISKNYVNTLNNTVLNYERYKDILALNMMFLVKKDPFPSYELLRLTNIQWLKFLYTSFVTKGAKTYGYPGYPPFPIG